MTKKVGAIILYIYIYFIYTFLNELLVQKLMALKKAKNKKNFDAKMF